ncbi:MAG: general secretion pathway protein GspK [Candidatus Hydrogenedentes bacterium]|nr:general secretion pathway protein GspK [Candidatus Hydrogenedentota bacterium]
MKRRNQNNGGFVMVVVLWVVALLTVLVLGFGHRASLDRRAAAYALDHAQAMAAARGAVERGALELANRGLMIRLLPPELRGGTHLGESWANAKNLYEEGLFKDTEGMEEDQVSYIITDEDRFININAAPQEILEELDMLNRSLVRRIMARREKEELPGEGISYFQSLEELRYLRGVDDDAWFGTKRQAGLKDLLTVWGDARININTASREVLEAVPGTRTGDLDALFQYRAGSDGKLNTKDDRGFRDMEDLTVKTGILGATREAFDRFCKCESSFFKITGLATRRKGNIRAVCSAIMGWSEDGPVIIEWQEKTLGS